MDPIGELCQIIRIRDYLNATRIRNGKQGKKRKTLCTFPRGVGQCLRVENGGFSFATDINPDSLPLLPTPSWEILLNCSSLDMALRAACGFQPQCF